MKEEKRWNLLLPLRYRRFYHELRFKRTIVKQRFVFVKAIFGRQILVYDHLTMNFNRTIGCEIGPSSVFHSGSLLDIRKVR